MSRYAPYPLWLILAIPSAIMFVTNIGSTDPEVFKHLLHPTGETSVRLLVITMLASPLRMLFRTQNWTGWLIRNRRYFGVASFFYAALHLVFYVLDTGSIQQVMVEFSKFYIWTGWVAFAIFLPLAITSTDGFVRMLRRGWKKLHRLTYPAAGLAFLHWASLDNWGEPGDAIILFLPLVVLSIIRLARHYRVQRINL